MKYFVLVLALLLSSCNADQDTFKADAISCEIVRDLNRNSLLIMVNPLEIQKARYRAFTEIYRGLKGVPDSQIRVPDLETLQDCPI